MATGLSDFWYMYTVYNYNADFSVSWNGSVPMTLCMTAANTSGDLQSIQYNWTNGFSLSPSRNYSISLSTVLYTLNSYSWVSFEPGKLITGYYP